jgi:hypothetical protein
VYTGQVSVKAWSIPGQTAAHLCCLDVLGQGALVGGQLQLVSAPVALQPRSCGRKLGLEFERCGIALM